MYFYLFTLNIVPSNACVESYRNKNFIFSYLRLSLLSPLSLDAQSYTKFLELKSTNQNARNFIYKIKRYFPKPVQGAIHTTLLCFYENYTAVSCKDQERELRFPFSKKYFIFHKWFLNSSEGIWQGQLTGGGREKWQFTVENSACTIITNTKLSVKNISEFFVVSDCVFYYFYIIQ